MGSCENSSFFGSFNFKSLKMVQKHSVEGFDNFKDKAEELAKEDVPLYVYFSGSKSSDGKSRCPDCVTAQPIVEATLEKELKDLQIICTWASETVDSGRTQIVY